MSEYSNRGEDEIKIIYPEVEKSWFMIMEALKPTMGKLASVELHAYDPDNQSDYLFPRGRLKLSDTGDLQIEQGKNWRLVKDLPIKLRSRLRLDDAGLAAMQAYFKAKSEIKPYRSPLRTESRAEGVEYNEKELRRFRLEKLEVAAYPVADYLLSRILESNRSNTDYIDINSKGQFGGQDLFCQSWNQGCADLPLPCVPPEAMFKEFYPYTDYPANVNKADGSFWYLRELAEGNIVKNIGEDKPGDYGAPAISHFGEAETIFMMDWEEDDFDAEDDKGKRKLQSLEYDTQPLLDELGIQHTGVVDANREQIDISLWEGDPGDRKQTKKHRDVIRGLHFNPDEWEFHCIRYDQYSRLANLPNGKRFGKFRLNTHFDDYYSIKRARRSLYGGNRERGGASHVGDCWRDRSSAHVGVRLVLSRKLP